MDILEILKNLSERPWETKPRSFEELTAAPILRVREKSVHPVELARSSEVERLLELARSASPRPAVNTMQPKLPPQVGPFINRGTKRVLVQRQSLPYWQERGWVRQGRNYEGCYRTQFGSWKGWAEVGPSEVARMFIHHPPAVLEDHPNWPCFFMRLDGWYLIHTHNPFGLSEGILRIEEILTEAHRGNHYEQ